VLARGIADSDAGSNLSQDVIIAAKDSIVEQLKSGE